MSHRKEIPQVKNKQKEINVSIVTLWNIHFGHHANTNAFVRVRHRKYPPTSPNRRSSAKPVESGWSCPTCIRNEN